MRPIALLMTMAILIASPAWGGMAAKRMLRIQSEIGYNVSTFTASDNGWTLATAGSGTGGTVGDVYELMVGQGASGTGYASITKTFACETGNLTFKSYRDNSYSSGRVLVDGAPVWAYAGSSVGAWETISIPISTGGSHTIKFEIPNTSMAIMWSLDDISVPVP